MQVIKIDDIKYPRRLKEIKNAPEVLYVEGDVELLNKDLISIIGSRNYSEYGKTQTKRFAKKISRCGIGIVSGMALGIDTFAHMETIKNGGKTVAVLGSGFDNIYPKENEKLYNLIIKTGGAVISEYPPNTKMQKRYFPLRNRIVSGLCLGTLVIEAAHRSGTSITANFAWKQGRKVYCIPNSIDNKNSCGTINLLKHGAKLVTKPQEIVEDLGDLNNKVSVDKKVEVVIEQSRNVKLNKYDDITKKIIKIIQQNVEADSNLIAERMQMQIAQINAILTNLEIEEIIQPVGSGKYIIT